MNDKWDDEFMNATVNFFPQGVLDHSACVIKMDVDVVTKPKPFRF